MSLPEQPMHLPEENEPLEGIAIVGMAGCFPGAPDLDTFWRNLVAGRDTITRFGPEELEARDRAALQAGPDYVRARGVLEGVDLFDADFFGIHPREAETLDPQHRVFLEVCAAALEDAGCVASSYAGEIGLFAGCSLNTYLLANLARDRATLDEVTGSYQVGGFQLALGNDKDFMTTRVAYKLGLRGPCVSVQSACATSLVAVCQAAQALLNYQCDMALAGGVSITFPQHRGHVYSEGGIVSRDGVCRPFDAAATGTVFGHGAGAVLLKRLEDAVRDGDPIVAVLRGFAVTNDGAAKAGYMAPGVDGQVRAIVAAQAMAGIPPETVSYVEAHGTGTPLGDPIEIAALTRAFRMGTAREGFCTVGTAKALIGHLDAAAGIAGLIKTALSLKHRTLPGLGHFERVNPAIELAGSPFRFAAQTQAWTADGPLRAGVSAFGVGGVNAHVVLEEAPARPVSSPATTPQVLGVSARSDAAARQAAENLAAWCESHPGAPLADVAHTLAHGRRLYPFRIAVAAAGLDTAGQTLRAAAARRVETATARRLAFAFPGQGSQYPGMAASLYDRYPAYRAAIDAGAEAAQGWLGFDLLEALLSPQVTGLDGTELAQPALFVASLAQARLWQSWGVEPEALLGHSLGEYVAAALAGVFRWEDALRLVCRRGQLMQAMQPGAMLSVALGEAALAPYAGDSIAVAVLNAPRASVLAGPLAAVEALETRLAADGIAARRLRTSHAFHTPAMQPMLAEFERAFDGIALAPPSRRIVSTVSGTWLTDAQATSPAYWTSQCVLPVRFSDAVGCLLADGIDTLVECGPGDALATLAAQHDAPAFRAVATQVPARSSRVAREIEDAAAQLWSLGVPLDMDSTRPASHTVSLPAYPFERKRFWVEPPQLSETTLSDPQPTVARPTPPSIASEASDQPRAERLRAEVAKVFFELSGVDIAPDEHDLSLLELGFDSLSLTQAVQALGRAFAVKLTFRQLMEEFPSVVALAAHFDAVLPAEAFAPEASAPRVPAASEPVATPLSQQIAALATLFAEQVAALSHAASSQLTATPSRLPAPPPAPSVAASAEVRFRPAQRQQHEITAQQQAYLEALTAKYAARTQGSKRQTQHDRPHLADPRAVAGFRAQWKEMVYPLLVERARGSRLWDIDGNESIDIVNGYGCILFGHSPAFVVEAATAQLERGVAIGPQSPLAGEVAALLCELTGNERVTFCNTGSEAVMAAMRVARTVTGRDTVVYFGGDYHGTFDEVLVRQTPRGSAPVAPGIPAASTTNIVVLEYGADAALDYLRANAGTIAAVLIEPVQTRNPALQPFDFIRETRRITEAAGAALILDEVVTGFRLAPGGMQQVLGIRADLCTYGKVIGGGHPIGVLSGKAQFLDALDGGAWQFGDDSGPEVGVTFFAGTFVRHPLALAAARAVLLHLRQAGPALQHDLNARTAALAASLDAFFVERQVPARIHAFASWFYFTFAHEARFAGLFYYAMRARGIHIQEGYPCFLTTAHSDADLAAIELAFRDTVVEMQAASVLPGGAPAAPGMHEAALPEQPVRVPLTEPQREILLAAALGDEASCAFNESLTLWLEGPFHRDDFDRAFEAVLARHDALRATVSADGDWLEIGSAAPAFDTLDLGGFTRDQQEETVARAAGHEGRTPFDLHRGPLLRATVFLCAPGRVALVLAAHHIVFDGWSANQLLEELGALYTDAAASLGPLLPFSSYAVREHAREREGDFEANESFWRKRFTGRAPVLELPTDRPRGQVKSYTGATLEGSLGAALYAELKRANARAGCSLYVTLLAGFEALLHRLTGQQELVVGISTAGQTSYPGAALVGHAVHFLPMLSQVEETTTVAEHLRATRTALLDAYDHQEFTYGSLLRKLKIAREPGRLPLIEVQFNLEKVGANVRFDGLTANVRANPKQFVNTDLFLNVIETGDDLAYMLDFNRDLFDEATVARWMQSWATLLASSAAAPEARVDDLEMLPAAERARLLSMANDTAVDLGAYEPVSATIARWAQREPGRIALTSGGVPVTYAELLTQARAIAARLRAEQLEPGALVGLSIERSPAMVSALLGALLAGCAYVPLDPRHPAERLEGIVRDSGMALLLTGNGNGPALGARTLAVAEILRAPLAALPDAVPAADALAYVIYTSGSTGMPKGVAVEHGALVNLLRSVEREPGLAAGDTLVAITTLAFDIAALELLLPLMTGAHLVVATDAEVLDGRKLLAVLERHRAPAPAATVLQATPGAWRILLDAGWDDTLPLKALCGGEALARELAERILVRAQSLWNMYGPTETTIWSSATRVQHGSGALRLGRPLANTQFHVLDRRHHLVPAGVAGELHIGGAGLARGYWNRPALTAEKFFPNPFGQAAQQGRLYSTGDLARRHEDGSIELLGRTDFQVKIRGYRIELAEIEAALEDHPGVTEAVVLQQISETAGAAFLIAYVAGAAAERSPALADALFDLLRGKLPEYMVPARIVVLDTLPRTPNGKIDRKALPALAGAAREAPLRTFRPAVSDREKLLAGIWTDVLEMNEVGLDDSIFELGADSLAIFRIAARAQREGLEVTAMRIFELRTIARILDALGDATAGDDSTPRLATAPRIQAAPRSRYRVDGAKAGKP